MALHDILHLTKVVDGSNIQILAHVIGGEIIICWKLFHYALP